MLSQFRYGIITLQAFYAERTEPPMIKKHQIYKIDKWNMLTVEVDGKTIILREISDQWGEECHTFLTRPELMHWVERRFPQKAYIGRENEWEEIMSKFREV